MSDAGLLMTMMLFENSIMIDGEDVCDLREFAALQKAKMESDFRGVGL
jgi:hypothetical protein